MQDFCRGGIYFVLEISHFCSLVIIANKEKRILFVFTKKSRIAQFLLTDLIILFIIN